MKASGTIAVMGAAPPVPAGLLDRARAGDAESFWALCEPLQQRLVRQALALCRDEHLARDLAQETMVAAWNSIRRYNGKCQFNTWLCSILLHKHRSALRRYRWARFIDSWSAKERAASAELVDSRPAPDRAAQLSERSQYVMAALDRLPGKQRETVFLRFYAEESLEGIAAAMNCSVGTVKSRLFHALERLRQLRILKEETA